MLGLSLLLTMLFALNSVFHLLTLTGRISTFRRRNLYRFIASALQLVTIPALLLLALNMYSDDAALSWISRAAPSAWESVLTSASPLFMLLEGLSTLLCIQFVARLANISVESTTSSTSSSFLPELLQLCYLISSAGTYVTSVYFLYLALIVTDSVTSLLSGVIVTALLFLTGISFALSQGNAIESSALFAYVVYQIDHIATTIAVNQHGQAEGIINVRSFMQMLKGKNGVPPLPPGVLKS